MRHRSSRDLNPPSLLVLPGSYGNWHVGNSRWIKEAKKKDETIEKYKLALAGKSPWSEKGPPNFYEKRRKASVPEQIDRLSQQRDEAIGKHYLQLERNKQGIPNVREQGIPKMLERGGQKEKQGSLNRQESFGLNRLFVDHPHHE